MKRFWKAASSRREPDGFVLVLDGRPARTPAKRPLCLPNAELARAVAAEWNATAEHVDPSAMPLTRLANAAIDQLPERRPSLLSALAGHLDTDLVCYRAAAPEELVRRQASAWDPPLAWLAATHGIRLATTDAVSPLVSPAEARMRLDALLAAMDDWRLLGLYAVCGVLGSIVLTLALADGRLAAEEALAASLLDEHWTMERWGEDAEQLARHRTLAHDLAAAVRFVEMLRGG